MALIWRHIAAMALLKPMHICKHPRMHKLSDRCPSKSGNGKTCNCAILISFGKTSNSKKALHVKPPLPFNHI
jgi:hypothetical protein